MHDLGQHAITVHLASHFGQVDVGWRAPVRAHRAVHCARSPSAQCRRHGRVMHVVRRRRRRRTCRPALQRAGPLDGSAPSEIGTAAPLESRPIGGTSCVPVRGPKIGTRGALRASRAPRRVRADEREG